MQENVSPVEALLDPDNDDNIILYNENNEAVEFIQIAIICLDNVLYPILKPAQPMEGLSEDEALVFVISEVDGEEALLLENDDAVIDAVFEDYYRLLREAGIDVD